jgi:hypothetical protein
VLEGAALLAAAIRAAIHAKAPRRTVQAVAAAVTGVLMRPTAATEPHIDAREPAGTSVEGIRSGRTAQRQRKKQRRRSAAAKAKSNASAKSAVVMQCETVRAAAPEVMVLALESGDALDGWKTKRRKKGSDGVRLGSGGSSSDVMALAGAEVLQRKAVRASAPMDVTEEEVLDDYWADEGMQQVDGAETEALRAEGLTRRATLELDLKKVVRQKEAMVRDYGEEYSELVGEITDRVRKIEGLLGMENIVLASCDWPPPWRMVAIPR